MRSLSRMKQDVWYSEVTEAMSDYDTISVYGKPKRCRLVVSATSGTPEDIAAGIVPDYERYLTYHKLKYGDKLNLEEGMVLWIDSVPKVDKNGELERDITYQIDEDGEIVVDDEGSAIIESFEYTTPPDYVLKKIIATQKGLVVRYGIAKIGGSDNS